jgi:hypothetical protein
MFETEVVDKIETHVLFSIIFFFETRAVCDIMWKNMVQPDRTHDNADCIPDT